MEQENQDQLNQLLHKLDDLLKRQEALQQDIAELKSAAEQLRPMQTVKPVPPPVAEIAEVPVAQIPPPSVTVLPPAPVQAPATVQRPKTKSDLEKFIGENLINKIGIAITIIGVTIGAKYSIEHDLISPLTRIIIGYMMGLGLFGVAVWLRKQYESFSSVLLSGSMAILYLITYFAYSFYALIPQVPAFGLMTLFTVFTVIAAMSYNRQIIALIGLVGAYAVPFLLSNESGRVEILFSYMAIINTGILVIAIKKYWKALFYAAFCMTWLIFAVWYAMDYRTEAHFSLGLGLATVFFVTFYATFIVYKLIKGEKFGAETVLLLAANSFIYYGLGYAMMNRHPMGQYFLGLFTLGNALLHFIACVAIYRQQSADRNMFYFVAGLVLVFITIAIPVQLDGHWVTMLWAGEAALLCWVGRTKNIITYERLSYAAMLLAFFSLIDDWSYIHEIDRGPLATKSELGFTPFLNPYFLTAGLVIAAFGFMLYLLKSSRYQSNETPANKLQTWMSYVIPAALIIVVYNAFQLELSNFLGRLYPILTYDTNTYDVPQSGIERNFKDGWLMNYNMLFLSLLALINIRKIKNQALCIINVLLSTLALFCFLVVILPNFASLSTTHSSHPEFFKPGILYIGIRYISLLFAGLLLWTINLYSKQPFVKPGWKPAFDFIFHLFILWILSREAIYWMEIYQSDQSDKLRISILWGIYALFLIILGIWKKQKHLRIGAIGLFSLTLLKLFFYDLSALDTIAKTVVFVSLGLLLLLISFLYQKYKTLIFDEDEP